MYVRVTPFRYNPAADREILRFTEQRLIPVLQQVPGFRRYTGAADAANGRGVTITEWGDDTPDEAIQRALAPLREDIAHLGTQMEATQIYPIRIHT
jgi:hypothetical protein